jgi:hypothetical protein
MKLPAKKKTRPLSKKKRAAAPPPRTTTIKLVRDAYGTNARASAIADFVEVACLAGLAPSEDELRDRLKDSETSLPAEKYVLFGEADPATEEEEEQDGDANERYADSARRIFELLRERSRILGDRYPFELAASRLRLRAQHSGDSYLGLLAMTIAHAHGIRTAGDPKRIFEETVARVLNVRGWKAANLARQTKAQRGAATFEAALAAVCATCDLTADVAGVILSRAANDEGVDTVAHHSWGDDRAGRWTLIGQATLEKSDGWRKKLREPSPNLYRDLFREHVLPLPFLAVPHHVEPLHLEKLVQDSGSVVLDRLRLARFDSDLSAPEREILDTVRACAVEYR